MRKVSIYYLVTYSAMTFVSMNLFNWQSLAANSTKLVNRPIVNRQIHHENKFTIGKSSGNWLLDRIISLFIPSHKSGGARGDNFVCANSPSFDNANNYLWTRRPLFMWSGSASSIKVVNLQSKKVIWNKIVDPNLKFGKTKIDKSLDLGGIYAWQVSPSKGSGSLEPSIKFKIVSKSQNARINLDLEKIENQSADNEEIILRKARYFADIKMWADVQELLLKIPPSSSQYEKVNNMIDKMQSSLGVCYEYSQKID